MQQSLTDRSTDYNGQVERLRALRSSFHEELAAAFEPIFNAALEAAPHEDLESKRALCTAANDTLKSLGLAIRCPRTGQPVIMVADNRYEGDEAGRFRLEMRARSGHHATRTLSSPTLVQFELMEDPARPEPLARRHRGKGPNPSR